MPIIVLTTAAGAPGASTTALGVTLSWPGPALLVEADPAGTSLVPGWFRGAIDPQERNIVNLALVERAEDLTEAIFDQAVSIAVVDDDEHQRLALLGLIEPVQAPALNGVVGVDRHRVPVAVSGRLCGDHRCRTLHSGLLPDAVAGGRRSGAAGVPSRAVRGSALLPDGHAADGHADGDRKR